MKMKYYKEFPSENEKYSQIYHIVRRYKDPKENYVLWKRLFDDDGNIVNTWMYLGTDPEWNFHNTENGWLPNNRPDGNGDLRLNCEEYQECIKEISEKEAFVALMLIS